MSKPRATKRQKTPISTVGEDTPPAATKPIPNSHRESMLPLLAVGSVKYEELCRDVLKHGFPQIKRKVLKRTAGQRQYGVDVEGFNAEHESEVVVSCKCWRDVEARHLRPWTQAFVDHLDGHWKDRGVKVFVLAFTHPGNSDELTAAIKECHVLLQPYGIQFVPWDNLDVTDLVRSEPQLIDRYFHPAWIDVISPRQSVLPGMLETARGAGAGRSASIIEMARELADLARDRDALVAQKIDDASAAYRAGRSDALRACLDDLQSDAKRWDTLEAPLRAKVLRSRAMLALNVDDVTSAGSLIQCCGRSGASARPRGSRLAHPCNRRNRFRNRTLAAATNAA